MMAELLVYTKNRVSDDPELDKFNYKRGDVVVVRDDGFEWGRLEDPKTHPGDCPFIIVHISNKRASELTNLVEVPVQSRLNKLNHVISEPTKRRALRLDIDAPNPIPPVVSRIAAMFRGVASKTISDVVGSGGGHGRFRHDDIPIRST